MLVDSHCHLNCLDLSNHQNDLQRALAFAREQDVGHFLCVAIDLEHIPEIIHLAEHHPDITASVGLHPNETPAVEPTYDELLTLAQHPRVIAIGETGLDYYRSAEENLMIQRQRFRTHIQVAKAIRKPLIIHMRDASADTLAILREENAQEIGGVMHCFTESLAVAEAAMDLNFYISFSGIVTFKNAQALQATATALPLDRILIETDAPYLAPNPLRGKSNEPAYLHHTAKFLANLHHVSYVDFANITTENFKRLFSGVDLSSNIR
ncbi:MAG: TatD family hydrolase [Legionellales bacterium]|nr:TatD family hydrolase [Legionellales bacterium]